MGRVFRHKTSQPTKDGLRKGNTVIGTGDENYGPTSTTGYVNALSPPLGGYSIYCLDSGNNPLVYIANEDIDLIEIANTLGGNVEYALEAKNYLNTRSDTWIIHNYPENTITSGLRLFLSSQHLASFINNEPTTNLLEQSGASSLSTRTDIYNNVTKTDFGNGKYRFKNNGNGSTTIRLYCNLSDLTDGETYACSVSYENFDPGNGTAVVLDWCDQGVTTFSVSTYGTKNRVSMVASRSTYNSTYRFFDISIAPNADITLYGAQVELGTEATSYKSGNGARTQNNTWYDLSGYSNNWTPLNNVTFNGQSFDFNGTTSYMQDTVSSFNPDSAPNVMEVLFKPMDLGSRRQAIFSDNYGPEYGIWIYNDNTLRGVAYTSVQTSNIEVGRWYYAVLNIQPGANKSSTDQTYIQFYVNGQFIGENNGNTGNGMNDQPFSLGFDYKSNNPNDFFSGSIALAKLSYGEFNQDNVNQNYYGGPITTNGLITALDFGNLVSYETGSSSGYSLTGSDSFDLFNSPEFTTDFGGGIVCEETDEFIALNDKTPTDYVSVECWYTRVSGGSGEDIVFNKESSWELKDNGGDLKWAVMASNQGWFWHDTGVNIDVGETAQVILTYDGDYVRFYKNGELIQSYSYPGGGVLASQTSCYPKLNSRGCTRSTVTNPGNHTFYQFRIYDRALTVEEAQQNFNAQKMKFGL